MVPEMQNETDIIFCHYGLFFALLPPCNLENKNFVRIKKVSGDIIILHMKNHDHMMYAS